MILLRGLLPIGLLLLCCVHFVSALEQYPLRPTKSRDPDGFLSPAVSLDSGLIVGTRVSIPSAAAIVDQFLGVPFVQSPPERFSPPSKPSTWDGLLETKHVKPACIQQFACVQSMNCGNMTLPMHLLEILHSIGAEFASLII
ncbi:hypothetical protein TSTA_082990 [Talaromyces stipitatus ATCC 10500]|uniref:Carboxylesterase type B domain-containing protein n=1 Tax=Talaromyces stipitatus (strain ATCC 10500 / CBS 375.48 / QM 6759 / NRRL 1006) TaxID=441959 RepID=B8LZ22_TALSN|nr:uncharacterized protein TSTA_082990 [Talaromyces stipitatus ATCC 10500]EED21066.1 hypothetical protein TSTA_082990 [Talaromyces stipitatus ATCC 10500]